MPVPAVLITGDTITSAPWLADTSIRYRLLYDDPTRLHAYADNRWIASPAELMQMRLQLALGNVDANAAPSSGVAHYRLQVELLDFEQLFDTPQSSRVSARAEAALLNISSGAMLAKHRFAVTLTTSPDVQGAVQGSARATDQLLRQIVQWTAEQLSGVSQGPTHLPNAPKP
ncbi:MAG: ABC-type transport auxiliary lipoprotein family protein [Gammaproteobacteria bacterium]